MLHQHHLLLHLLLLHRLCLPSEKRLKGMVLLSVRHCERGRVRQRREWRLAGHASRKRKGCLGCRPCQLELPTTRKRDRQRCLRQGEEALYATGCASATCVRTMPLKVLSV